MVANHVFFTFFTEFLRYIFQKLILVQTLSSYVFILVFILPSSQSLKHLIKYSLSLQSQSKQFYIFPIAFRHIYRNCIYGKTYFLLLSLSSSLTLNVLTYPLILSNIKTNGLIYLSKNPIKYLQTVFVSPNFEITILSILTSQIFIVFFAA